MARIIVELTNRCNLSCRHCFDERHAAAGDLPLELLDQVLRQGKECGIDEICFTGGEPTVHRQFETIVGRVCEAGYDFSMVSNGMNFLESHPVLLAHRNRLRGLTFSLDGAEEATHDRIRGKGSFRRVLRAAALCLHNGIRFSFNMVLTAWNVEEVAELIELAERLGSSGVRFGHLMFTPQTAARGLDLSPLQRRQVEAHIWALRDRASIPVGMAPGYFAESPAYRCAPLQLEEYNLDFRGNVTLCCQLSGFSGPNTGQDLLGNLRDISLKDALVQFRHRVALYLRDKNQRIAEGAFTELDHFPCFYCVKYLGKAAWLHTQVEHPWARNEDRRKKEDSPC